MVNIAELEKLAELYKSGAITMEEFEMLKVEILNNDKTVINEERVESNKQKEVTDSLYDVILIQPGSQKLDVCKVIKDILGYDLKESKRLVDNVPSTVIKGVALDKAEWIKLKLEGAGAKAKISAPSSAPIDSHEGISSPILRKEKWMTTQPSGEVEKRKLSHEEEKAAREQKWAEEDKADRQKSNTANSKLLIILAVIVGVIVFMVTFWDNNSKSKNSTPGTNNSPTSSSNNGSNYVSYTKCSICGRQFTGNGYEEVSDGVWKLCKDGEQSYICSPECGMVHTRKMNELMQKAGVSTKCSHCGLGTYQNGYCNYCGAASPERVNESYSNMPKCQGCNGTGWRDNEVCPLCDGKGVKVY